MSPGLWQRLRGARLVRVLLVYGGASYGVLEATDLFIDKFGLPDWLFAAALILLLVGLVVVVTTAFVQTSAAAPTRGAAGPTLWEIDLVDLKESVARGRLPRLTWARAIVGGLVAFSLLFGFSGLYVLLTQRRPATAPAAEAAARAGLPVAVLPFRAVGPEAELWREGMVDLLYNNLDGVAGLRVVNPRTVLRRWREPGGAGGARPAESDLARPARIARDVGARFAITGNLIGSASAVRITAELHDLESGELRRAQVEGSPDSVLALVDRLCMEILRSGIAPEARELPQLDLSRVTTTSLPALKAYLTGERNYRHSRFREAIADFQRAVEEDSTFALALYRISQSYGWLDPFSQRTAEYSERATRFADRLPEREALLLRSNGALDVLRFEAFELAEELTARYPDDVEAWQALGEAYLHVGEQRLLPRDQWQRAFQHALELDPDFGPAYIHLVDDALIRRDSARARALIERHRRIDPTSPHARGLKLVYALAWGDSATRAAARAALDTLGTDALFTAWARFAWSAAVFPEQEIEVSRALWNPRHPQGVRGLGLLQLAFTRAHLGRYREARAALDSGLARPGEEGFARTITWMDLNLQLTGATDTARARRDFELLAVDPEPWERFWLGVFAISREDWRGLDVQIRALESAPGEAGGPAAFTAADGRAIVQALRGYADLRRERYRRAMRELEQALPGLPVDANALVRYDLGKLALELGELSAAERYLKSLELFTQARVQVATQVEYYLGELYERRGEPDRAKAHYARFVRWWEDADPELQPWVERGRRALERLTRESAG